MTHYFETPTSADDRFDVPMRLLEHDVTLASSRGVFSGAGLDLGTAVLLRTVTPPDGKTDVVDLGCGIGPITVALGLTCPQATITAVDVNARARDLTRVNAGRYGLTGRVRVVAPEDIDDGEEFDEIWSNPPIRVGKAALHDLLRLWLPRLRPHGVAFLVVARNLGADSLASWLVGQGWSVDRLGSAKGFRVLKVNRSI